MQEYTQNGDKTTREYIAAVGFDLRDSLAVEWFYLARAVWQEQSDIVALGPEHFVLTISAPGASA